MSGNSYDLTMMRAKKSFKWLATTAGVTLLVALLTSFPCFAPNQAPTISGTIPDQSKDEDALAWTLDLTSYESDREDSGTALNWSVSGVDTALFTATVTDSDNDIVTFTPVADAYGSDAITLTLTDSGGKTATQDITVTLNPVNDPPVANDDSDTTPEDTPVSTNVVANDTDVDGTVAPTTVTIVNGPSNGSTLNNGDGTVTYTPNENLYGSDSYE